MLHFYVFYPLWVDDSPTGMNVQFWLSLVRLEAKPIFVTQDIKIKIFTSWY